MAKNDVVCIDSKMYQVAGGAFTQINLETTAKQVRFEAPEDGEAVSLAEKAAEITGKIDSLEALLQEQAGRIEKLEGDDSVASLQASLAELKEQVAEIAAKQEASATPEPQEPAVDPEEQEGGDENGEQVES